MTIFGPFLVNFEAKNVPESTGNVENLKNLAKLLVIFYIFDKCQKFRYIFDICLKYRYIPVHFRKILNRESPVDFRKIFDRRNFSTFDFRLLTFDFREIPKVFGKRMVLIENFFYETKTIKSVS